MTPTHENTPPWQSDLLACYPALLERLQACKHIKKVCTAKELTDLDTGKVQVPLDGAVYVILDSLSPIDNNNGGRESLIQLGFSVILAKQSTTAAPNLDGIGITMTAICKALQGFEPKSKDGKHLTLSPFVQEKGLPIRYSKGFCLYPFRFSTTVAVVAD